MTYTDWYPASLKPLPERVGVYQVKAFGEIMWCRWDGNTWGLAVSSRRDVPKNNHSYAKQDKEWRGVIQKRNVKSSGRSVSTRRSAGKGKS